MVWPVLDCFFRIFFLFFGFLPRGPKVLCDFGVNVQHFSDSLVYSFDLRNLLPLRLSNRRSCTNISQLNIKISIFSRSMASSNDFSRIRIELLFAYHIEYDCWPMSNNAIESNANDSNRENIVIITSNSFCAPVSSD